MSSGEITPAETDLVASVDVARQEAIGLPASAVTSVRFGVAQTAALPPYDFTGDGLSVAFTLGVAPASAAKIASVNVGVAQTPSAWSLSGTILTSAAALPNAAPIEIKVGP